MTTLRHTLLALFLVCPAAAASAQSYYPEDDYGDRSGGAVSYDFARVVDVQPVYDEVAVSEPRRVCWNEPVTYVSGPRYAPYRRGGETPDIVGGIIGGLIGNQFGHGDGRAAATVAGFALGTAVARDNNRRYYDGYAPRYERTVTERRCEERPEYRKERQLLGYDVTYDYKGVIGHSFSERQPGTEIRVRVAVEPADD
ncbi:MAG: glycine zipper 2TM domain-containing protein [Xanthomonadales bacterium]|nr:glycine zipper 2TM domain-containing protein [Xanthomonadales bacterium]